MLGQGVGGVPSTRSEALRQDHIERGLARDIDHVQRWLARYCTLELDGLGVENWTLGTRKRHWLRHFLHHILRD